MTLLRALSLTVMMLAIASSSVTMAVARHQPRAIAEVVLCTGHGTVSVAVDHNGQPTGAQVPCPDCIPAMAALTEVALPAAVVPATLAPLRFALRARPAPIAQTSVHHLSRGPPVLV